MGLHVPAQMCGPELGLLYQRSGIFVVSNEKKEPSGQFSQMPLGAEPDWWNSLANSTQCREKLLSFVASCQSQLKNVIEQVNFEPGASYLSTLNGERNASQSGDGVVIKEEFGNGGDNGSALNNNYRSGEVQNGFVKSFH